MYIYTLRTLAVQLRMRRSRVQFCCWIANSFGTGKWLKSRQSTLRVGVGKKQNHGSVVFNCVGPPAAANHNMELFLPFPAKYFKPKGAKRIARPTRRPKSIQAT